ncbi:MAG TPA: ribosome-associated translation inhibitor RaiA [bacterium]
MDIKVRGKNIELTPAIKDYIFEKIGKLEKYFDQINSVDVALTVEKNRAIEKTQRAEVTMFVNGSVIRGEESSVSMYSSVDIVVEKLERQLKKYKSKIYNSSRDRRGRGKEQTALLEAEPEIDGMHAEDVQVPNIARTKTVTLRPMTPTEATLQMEMLGHDFHLFLDPETGSVNLVYRRQDGDYGLLIPESISR